MFAFKLIQLIETRAEPLSEGLMRKLKKNDRCIELLRRVPSDELRSRSHEIYRNLNDWLRNKTESEIEEYGVPMPRLFYLLRVLVPDRRKIEDAVKKAI